MITLIEARQQLLAQVDAGVVCPCCKQLAKRYKRKLYARMSAWLIWLVREWERQPRWIDVKASPVRGGDYAKLVHWGLIEHHPPNDDKKRTSGLWRPTVRGIKFVRSEIRLSTYVFLYDGKPTHFSSEMITIQESLGKHFDYGALMRGEW